MKSKPPDPRKQPVYGRATRSDARIDYIALQLRILIDAAENGQPCPRLLAPPKPRPPK